MSEMIAKLKSLQRQLVKHFGKELDGGCGEATLYIGRKKIDLTSLEGVIVARGPCQVATVLRRKRRSK